MKNLKSEIQVPRAARDPKFENASQHAKTWRILVILCFLIGGHCLPASAQDYSIDWFTVDGGGGTSTGGVFSVSGTIGQPDASATTMTGGDFSLTGGFWSLQLIVQTPGVPKLSVFSIDADTVVISWPSPSTGWELQQNTDLNTTDWMTPAESISNDGTKKFITVTPATGNRFYRLVQP